MTNRRSQLRHRRRMIRAGANTLFPRRVPADSPEIPPDVSTSSLHKLGSDAVTHAASVLSSATGGDLENNQPIG